MIGLCITTIVLSTLLIGTILAIKCKICSISQEGMKIKPKKNGNNHFKRDLLPRVEVVLMVVTTNDPYDIVLQVIEGWKKIRN